jgi:diacylglycerol kinase (ATP)
MIIVVNPAAGGGTAVRKLKVIESEIRSRRGDFSLEFTRSLGEIRTLVATKFAAGERRFVAAGGDGCVNALVNALMTALTEYQRSSVSLGAIGLGSSNDFHKPLSPDRTISGVPWKTDFSSTRPRDVVNLEFGKDGSTEQRYFLINASVGLTAEANRFFNSPNSLLSIMKRTSTSVAIFYAAFNTMATYRSRRLTIESDGERWTEPNMTNLAILKSLHVSGSLKFPGDASYDSGLLRFHIAGDLQFGGRLRLFQDLATGREPKGRSMSSWQSGGATLSSDRPFALEFDGEVITTDKVHISILPRHLQVCTC